MICTNCGAHLMETDLFCSKCGTKAIKDKRCPDCGALLRDGVTFCPKCGRLVGEDGSAHGVSDDTLGIPIDAIEQNILSETAAEIKADHRTESAPRRTASRSTQEKSTTSRSTSEKNTVSRSTSEKSAASRKSSEKGTSHKSSSQGAPVKKKASNPEPPRKKKVVYRDEDWEDEDWEDDDWDEDDDDDEGVDVITVMTAVVGCVLLVVVAVLGFHLYRQYAPKDYDRAVEEEQEEQEEQEQDQEPEEISEGGSGSGAEEVSETYTLTVIHNVNVRDNPSTSGTNVLKVAKEGETYTCYGSVNDGEWYEILLEDGSTGYVFYEYISIE